MHVILLLNQSLVVQYLLRRENQLSVLLLWSNGFQEYFNLMSLICISKSFETINHIRCFQFHLGIILLVCSEILQLVKVLLVLEEIECLVQILATSVPTSNPHSVFEVRPELLKVARIVIETHFWLQKYILEFNYIMKLRIIDD